MHRLTNNQVVSKQDSLQWLAATGTAFVNPTDLNVRRPPVSVNIAESGRWIFLHADCYSKSESDARYVQNDPSDFTVVNSNGPQL